jgi:DnaJ-class molecular chaperone
MTCPVCNGTGKKPNPPPQELGTPCPRCGGTGTVPNGLPQP